MRASFSILRLRLGVTVTEVRPNCGAISVSCLRIFWNVQLAAGFGELQGLRGHLRPHLFGDAHRAKLRAAHRAKVRELGAVGRQRLVVKLLCGIPVERQVELLTPPELEAS